MDSDVMDAFDDSNEWAEEVMNSFPMGLETHTDELAVKSSTEPINDDAGPSEDHLHILRKVFGYNEFRSMQWKIINSILMNRQDNCAIMATGYGKSLCYQFPPVYCGGVGVIISPLISLMEDQVLSLQMSNIEACLLGMANTKQTQTIEEILENKYNIIYMSPEFCFGEIGSTLLDDMQQKLNIVLIAIDEAHCVSSWGHDFRPKYRELGKLKKLFPQIPMLAVTATATPKVKEDIISSLNLRSPQVLCTGFDRPNLHFAVLKKGQSGPFKDLKICMAFEEKMMMFTFPGPTIIYCLTRKVTEEVSTILKNNGIEAAAYHAGLGRNLRKEIHQKFMRDKIECIVATIAFGMGIDKPDVRMIIHYGAPKNIESYYQEVGRAGRDGQPAKCVIFYSQSDFHMHKFMRDNGFTSSKMKQQQEKNCHMVQKYLDSSDCRRQFILDYFKDDANRSTEPRTDCCDNCTHKSKTMKKPEYEGMNNKGEYDFTDDAIIFLSSVKAFGKTILTKLLLFIRGSKSVKVNQRLLKHPLHGKGMHHTEIWWKCIDRLLDREGYLQKDRTYSKMYSYDTISLNARGFEFLGNLNANESPMKLLIAPLPEMLPMLKKKTLALTRNDMQKFSSGQCDESCSTIVSSETNRSEEETEDLMKIYRLLLNRRMEISLEMDCMPYMVASNEVLKIIAETKPMSLTELRKLQLDGFTEVKIEKFGKKFIDILQTVCSPFDNKMPIRKILSECPLPNSPISSSAYATYEMFSRGTPIKELAGKRNISSATIIMHLISCMRNGYVIKLIDFGVNEMIRDTIIKVIRSPPISNDMSMLTPIKKNCPEEITFDNIKVVIAYLQLREHLHKLMIPYKEYEDFDYEEVNLKNSNIDASSPVKLAKLPCDDLADIKLTEFPTESEQIDLLLAEVFNDDSMEVPPTKRHKQCDNELSFEELSDAPDSPILC